MKTPSLELVLIVVVATICVALQFGSTLPKEMIFITLFGVPVIFILELIKERSR